MNIRILLLLIISLLFTACNDKIKKEYHKSGKLKAEYESLDNKKHGHFKNYFENGQLDWEAEYTMDTLNGLFKDYSEEGALISEGYLKKGKQDGISKFYHPNGNLESETVWKEGKKDGYFKEFKAAGNLFFYAILERDSVIYWEKYNDSSQITELFRKITIVSLKDTVRKGEEFKGQVVISGPHPENVKLTLALMPYGRFKEKVNYITIPVKNGIVEYVLQSYRVGEFFIDATISDSSIKAHLQQKIKDVFVVEN